jgi:hypothetical protein
MIFKDKKIFLMVLFSLFLMLNAYASVPVVFTNGTTADATEVNQNFNYFENKFSATSGHNHDGSNSMIVVVSTGDIVANRILGTTNGVTPVAGYIGQILSGQCTTTATNTSSNTDLVTLTLTTGVWLVSANGQSDNTATQTGFEVSLVIKGTGGVTIGIDQLDPRYPAAQSATFTFANRVVVVAASDGDKTVVVQGKSVTASGSMEAYISAVRIA